MKIKSAEFVTSAGRLVEMPTTGLPEFAFGGRSNVGKSSLINRLLGDDRQRVATISDKSGEGRHTTVNSAMLQLPGGGSVIDSPGVRDYAPALQPEEVVVGRHGLMIKRDDGTGLLLPDVAVRYGWDREEFLRGVCSKAGLPETAWRGDDAELYAFETESWGEEE